MKPRAEELTFQVVTQLDPFIVAHVQLFVQCVVRIDTFPVSPRKGIANIDGNKSLMNACWFPLSVRM